MKITTRILALVMASALSSSAAIVIGGATNNGDFEAAALTPFTATGGSISSDFDHTTGTGQSLAINLTAPNAFGQWKPLTNGNNVSAPAAPGDMITFSAWVYVPTAATFGAADNFVGLQLRSDSGSGNGEFGDTNLLNLDNVTRDTWTEISSTFNVPTQATNPGATQEITSVNTGGWNVATNASLDGYTGFIYIDDVSLDISPVPEPSSLLLAGLSMVGLLRRKRA